MVAIPQDTITQQDLVEWDVARQELAKLKLKEMMLRQRIFKGFFPVPVEGTNTHPLAQGWVLKGVYSLNRAVDIGAFTSMRDLFQQQGLRPDVLVKFTPELVKSEYSKLTKEEQNLFDRCLLIKEGSPTLKIELPAKNRPKEGTTS